MTLSLKLAKTKTRANDPGLFLEIVNLGKWQQNAPIVAGSINPYGPSPLTAEDEKIAVEFAEERLIAAVEALGPVRHGQLLGADLDYLRSLWPTMPDAIQRYHRHFNPELVSFLEAA